MAEYLEVEGDLFDPAWGFQAIGHGCNTFGVMGAGIAKQFRDKYPGILVPYKDACVDGSFKLGAYQAFAFSTDPWFVVFNFATQRLPGDVTEHGTEAVEQSYAAIAKAVYGALQECKIVGIPVLALPQIGAGIAGLDWDIISDILRESVSHTGVGITVVKYVP